MATSCYIYSTRLSLLVASPHRLENDMANLSLRYCMVLCLSCILHCNYFGSHLTRHDCKDKAAISNRGLGWPSRAGH